MAIALGTCTMRVDTKLKHMPTFEILIRATNKKCQNPLSMLECGRMYLFVHSKCFVDLPLGWGGAKCVKCFYMTGLVLLYDPSLYCTVIG